MEMQNQLQIRKAKGLEIAKTGKVKLSGNKWVVPSQSLNRYYDVTLRLDKSECNCPDFAERSLKCKHIFAVEWTVSKQLNRDGSVTVTKIKRITYAQDWTAYNKAQTSELKLFDELLTDLLLEIDEPVYTFGRPQLPLREQLFCSITKVYSQLSSRRASTLYNYATERGFIQHKPHFNVVTKLLNRADITPLLKELVVKTSMPLRTVETDFAIDSSGFRTTNFNQYCKEKHKTNQFHNWLKAHICIGTKTNIITSVEIGDEHSSDSLQFIPLVNQTHSQGFSMQEVSGDKAYLSRDNLDAVANIGGVAYIPFKSNSNQHGRGGKVWNKMYYYFKLCNDEFMEHYHKRSNVETTFSAIKKKLGETIKSKNKTAQINELLCKIIAYNITVLIQEMFELGLEPNFYIKV
jgi:transposase